MKDVYFLCPKCVQLVEFREVHIASTVFIVVPNKDPDKDTVSLCVIDEVQDDDIEVYYECESCGSRLESSNCIDYTIEIDDETKEIKPFGKYWKDHIELLQSNKDQIISKLVTL